MRKGICLLIVTGFLAILAAQRFVGLNERAFAQNARRTPKPDLQQQYRDSHPEASLSPLETLGKDIFFDKNLSNPSGVSCASCHNPEAGYAGSVDSKINEKYGVGIGALHTRCENRNPPTITYSKFCPAGPPVFNQGLQSYVGGFFRDGRKPDLKSQVRLPLMHPNEMNNNIDNVPAPQLVVEKIRTAEYAPLVRQVFGANVFNQPTDKILDCVADAVTAFESSKEVSPFSSKYDAYLAGKAQLTPSEKNGFELVTGFETGSPNMRMHKSAQCAVCHTIQIEHDKGPDLWTQYCYTNIGVPKNLGNPYYYETNRQTNPLGYNPLGWDYIDLGLGGFLYPEKGLPPGNIGPGNNGQGDFLSVNGVFKVPTLRNVDKRPYPGFVKAYMHNGYFKSLKDIVHFYNTRNLTSVPGEIIDFTKDNPYQSLKGKPIWPAPEYAAPVTLVNPTGQSGGIGNLGLTEAEEADIVAFLKTLSDAHTQP